MPETTNDDFDSPWKDVLEIYFEEFMAFFFPDAHRDIDWSRGYENRDTELQQIMRDAKLGKRLADKLMVVYRYSGERQLVLIHIEIQGDYDSDFSERMYVYHYRIYDLYREPIVSLAILGDERPGWRPDHFTQELWGCRSSLHFPTIKLLDYQERWPQLENNLNPFAVMVMAHLRTKASRNDPKNRLQYKLTLVKQLYERGYQRQDILELFRFIDWLLRLPEELEQQFKLQLSEYEAAMSRPYITSIERHGHQQGLAQGLEQGLEQGQLLHAHRSVITILEARFGKLANDLRQSLESLQNLNKLDDLLKAAATADSLATFQNTFIELNKEDTTDPH